MGKLNTINTTFSKKQNKVTAVVTPPRKYVSNNLNIDLSAYPLKMYVDGELNNTKKQNKFSVSTPLIKDIGNDISIDLSKNDTMSYLLSSITSSTYATISNLNAKQNKLTVFYH
jgi:hypothetical protein